jgi:hypothetical protein
MSNVEDKIKELLEASMQEATAPGGKGVAAEPMKKIDADADGVEDAGAAVVSPDDKNGPAEMTKKVKKAAVPGGEANKGEQSIKPGATKVKEEEEADEELEVVAEEEASEDEIVEAKKTVAKEEDDEEEASDDEGDDDDDDDDDKEMEEMKKKLHAMVDKMDEMGHMKKPTVAMRCSSLNGRKKSRQVTVLAVTVSTTNPA